MLRRLSATRPKICSLICALHPAYLHEQWTLSNAWLERQKDGDKDVGWRYDLRMTIHVLEKGLAHKHPKSIFGLRHIARAVELTARLERIADECKESVGDKGLRIWAHEVLSEYFRVIGRNEEVKTVRCAFEKLKPVNNGGIARTPYFRKISSANESDYEAFMKLAQKRVSTRWFLPKTVPREMIDKAIAVAALSPSGCCQQAFEFRIFDDSTLIKQLQTGINGFTGFSESVTCLAVVIGDFRSAMGRVLTHHDIYIDASLATMSFQYGLEAQGLGSCCLHWPLSAEKDALFAKIIGIKSYERPIMCLAIGFPDPEGKVAFSQKKCVEELRAYNKVN